MDFPTTLSYLQEIYIDPVCHTNWYDVLAACRERFCSDSYCLICSRTSMFTFCLFGMCSPLSIDQTRSNCPSGNGCSRASATWKEACAKHVHIVTSNVKPNPKYIWGLRLKSQTICQERNIRQTLSDNPCAAARAFPLSACTGLNVIPEHCAPYLLARYLELPPIPHPTSTIVLGLFVGSSASTRVRSSNISNTSCTSTIHLKYRSS